MDKLVAAIPVGKNEELRVHLKSLNGLEGLDVRLYAAGPEEKVATGKGFWLPAGCMADLKRSIDEAEKILREKAEV